MILLPILYYSLLGYSMLNAFLSGLQYTPIEHVFEGISAMLGVSITIRHGFAVLGAVAFAATITHKKKVADPFIAIFSFILTFTLGITMLICSSEGFDVNPWLLTWILFAFSGFLEWWVGTLRWTDLFSDFMYSGFLSFAFLYFLNWAHIPVISWDAFLVSAFFGLAQCIIAVKLHVLPKPAQPKAPDASKPVGGTKAQVTKKVVKKEEDPKSEKDPKSGETAKS